MDLKFHFMLMNDHFSIQILSEPSFTVFPQDSGSVKTLKILPDILQTILQSFSTSKWCTNISTHVSIDFWQMHCVNQCLVIVDFALMPHSYNVQFWTDHNIMLHMPCSSNPWFWSTKSFYVNFIFSLNSLASNFLSNSIKIEKWFLMWGLNDIFVFNLYCCWMWWNGIFIKTVVK